ncbi:MAG: alpha/beta hydrolase-fold protein [Chitinophagaceae bacterium]
MKQFSFLIMVTLIVTTSFSQNVRDTLVPNGQMEGVKAIKLTSSINHHDYVILVKLPASYNDTLKKAYPVMYVLDAQWTFPQILDAQNALLYDNLVDEMIYVGIAFPQNWFVNRNRDFTPTHTDFDSVSGGAPAFLDAIKKEIIPYINSAYRTDKKNNGLVGGSLGGLFVLYTLFQQPSAFNRFIVNSPSLWYDNQLLYKMEKDFSEKHQDLNAKLYISTGGYEEEMAPAPAFKSFCDQLRARNYKGLEMESLVVEKTGHLTASSYGNIRGLQFVYNKADVKVDSSLLNQFAGHYELGMTFVRQGNSMYVDMGTKKILLHAISNESFFIPGSNGIAEFTKDAGGKTTGVNLKTADGSFYSKKID